MEQFSFSSQELRFKMFIVMPVYLYMFHYVHMYVLENKHKMTEYKGNKWGLLLCKDSKCRIKQNVMKQLSHAVVEGNVATLFCREASEMFRGLQNFTFNFPSA